MPLPPSNFPLRWETTAQQWWYASPIDLAAANGHYDLVIELLHLDTNLLIKLTSLQRIRRLESLWNSQFSTVAKCRSRVAKNLMIECETEKKGRKINSLVKAGYGGWLLYTAASAGDVDFVCELLRRESSLVFGEGEYGVTDILYAAARSKNCEVFKILFDCAILKNSDELVLDEVFKIDMVNRGVHAAARGGNWEILKEFVGSDSDILAYRDSYGCTVLHTASATGQVEVVRKLLESFDVINLTDAQGNTALHVACYSGYLPVVEILIHASPSLASLTNHHGDTFLHLAVAGFKSPGFCRLDKHTELMKQLVSEKIVKTQDIINVKNNDGRTALHVSVIDNIQCDVVELLMSVPSIDLNVCDSDGMTPLDLLKQRSQSASSDILIKRLISAGGINCKLSSYNSESSCTPQKIQISVNGGSPGTSFRIPDAEIFLYTGIENASNANYDQTSLESYSCSSELGDTNFDTVNSPYNNKSHSVNYTARRLKYLLRWPRRKDTKATFSELEDDDSLDPFSSSRNLEEFSIPLRQRYSQPCSLRGQSIRSSTPSPSSKMNFTAGLMQGVIQLNPHGTLPTHSTPNLFQELSVVSLSSIKKQKGLDIMGPSCSYRSIKDDGALQLNYKQGSFNKKTLMNRYLSFGAEGLTMEDTNRCESNGSYKRFSSLVA
ncbi:unnamed protein product [Trifolium pratense]|uniref:Uncharacterized protein n=2 Tax=Trifolium pratense TaxID=57577 RepID=A0ACB0LF78_TRIPR|nr:unnamed protein product [Trifolium pratense]CAJ2668010.1 unnamed protein product [Trifolium pratense]